MVDLVLKLHEGRPNIVDAIKSHSIHLVINTPNDPRLKGASQIDDQYLRRAAILYNVPYTTTLAGATAAVEGIEALRKNRIAVMALQEYHQKR
jgi:carbamoyl-phosphate synthase large subunit